MLTPIKHLQKLPCPATCLFVCSVTKFASPVLAHQAPLEATPTIPVTLTNVSLMDVAPTDIAQTDIDPADGAPTNVAPIAGALIDCIQTDIAWTDNTTSDVTPNHCYCQVPKEHWGLSKKQKNKFAQEALRREKNSAAQPI